MDLLEGKWTKAQWIAALLVTGYLLGKVITFFFAYKGARWLWAWRKRRAEAAQAAGGGAGSGPEELAAPLLDGANGGIEPASVVVVAAVAEDGAAGTPGQADGARQQKAADEEDSAGAPAPGNQV